jgi:ABC-2 type transport system permease protein
MNIVVEPSAGHLIVCYLREARHELMRLARTPSFVLPTLLFPALFYLLFGVILAKGRGGGDAARYLLATYGVFGIMGVSLFGFGVTVAIERERRFLTLKRTLPMPPGAYLFAKLMMAMSFAAIISIMLAILATTLGGVILGPTQWLALFVINVLGTMPFCALGLWIGTLVGGSAAPAVVNLIYLPMSFLSGLWLPLNLLPEMISRFAPIWPSYHLGQISLAVVGGGAGDLLGVHIGVLLAMTAVFFTLAQRKLAGPGSLPGR